MSNKHQVGLSVTDFVDNGIRQKITSVTLQTANDQTITAGRYDGIDLYALCPYATQEMALAILVQVQDYQYQAFDAKAAGIDPAAELGDGVNVCGIYGVLSSIEDHGDGFPDISAPGEQELEDEYPYQSRTNRSLSNDTDSLRAFVTQSLGAMQIELNSMKTALDTLTLKVNDISLAVTNLESRVSALEGK